MNAEAANKLLKLLEEPPALTQFMFVSHKPERLLPTIASRCLRIRLGARKKEPELMAFDSPELFSELMDALLSKNLLSCIETGERIAALPSRESAKAFCRYAADNIRHIFLCQQGLEGGLTADVSRWAGRCPKTFPRKALAVLDRAQSLVDRNVNLRILFTDMADRLFLLI